MMRLFSILPAVLAGFLSLGCVDLPPGSVPEEAPVTTVTPGSSFPALDPGAKDLSSLHFQVHAYGSERASQVSDMAEAQYNQIMTDTGLYSFMPPGLYSLVIYGTRDEYLKKTGQPEWSGGLTYGNAIYSYESSQLPMTLAHEMVHLLFYEYMASARADLRWFNEGLAVYEENVRAAALGYVPAGSLDIRRAMRQQPIPFDQMVTLIPATERQRTVNTWYQQVGAVVGFMIERGGRNGFYQFLSSLKDRKDVDASIRAGFPNVWNTMADFEAAWKRSL